MLWSCNDCRGLRRTGILPGPPTDEMLPFAGLHEMIGEKPRVRVRMGYKFIVKLEHNSSSYGPFNVF